MSLINHAAKTTQGEVLGCPKPINYGWVKVIDQTGNVTKEWGRYAEHDPWEDDAGIDFSNLVAVPVEEAEQGADVTDSVTPELQHDNGSN